MLRRTFLTVLITAAIPVTVFAQAKSVTLKHAFPDGRKTVTEIETKLDQNLEINGTPQKTSNEAFVTVETANGTRSSDGVMTLTQTVKKMQSNLDLGVAKINFDSENPDVAAPIPPLQPIIDAMKFGLKTPKTIKLDAKNKVTGASVPDDVEVPRFVEAEYKSDAMVKAMKTAMSVIPSKPISKGDAWELETEMALGQGQVMTLNRKFTYQGTVQKDGKTLHKLTSKVLKVDFDMVDSPLPLDVKSSDLKADESEHELLFDADAGMVVQDKSKMKITGKLKFAIQGMELDANLVLNMATTSKSKVAK